MVFQLVFLFNLLLFGLRAEGAVLNTTKAVEVETGSPDTIPSPLPDYLANKGDWDHVDSVWGTWNGTGPFPPNIPYRRSPQCSADYSSSYLSNTKVNTQTAPSEMSHTIGCCGPECMLRIGDVNVYYFPTEKSNFTCLQYLWENITHATEWNSRHFPDTRTAANSGNVEIPFPTQPPPSSITPRALRPRDGESIFVDSKGFTFKSPYMYLEILTIDAVDGCGYLGEKYTSLTWSFLPGQLSITNGRMDGTTQLYPDYLPCPPESIAEWDWYNYVLPGRPNTGLPWRPTILPPPQVSILDPSWAKGCSVDWNQGIDPPMALKAASMPGLSTTSSSPDRTEAPQPGPIPPLPPTVTTKPGDPPNQDSNPGQPSAPINGIPQNGQPLAPSNGVPQGGQPAAPPNGAPQNGQPISPPNSAPPNGQPPLPPNGAPPNGQPLLPPNGDPQNGSPSNGNPQVNPSQNGNPQNGDPQNGDPPNGVPQNGNPTLPVLQPLTTLPPANLGPQITPAPNSPNAPNAPNAPNQDPGAPNPAPGAPNSPSSSLVVYKVPDSDLTLTYDPSSKNYIIGSQTVQPGGSIITVSGHVFSVPAANPTGPGAADPPPVIVDGTSTYAVTPGPGTGTPSANGGGGGGNDTVENFTGAGPRCRSASGTKLLLYSFFSVVLLLMISI